MADIPIEQALYGNAASGGFQFLARSPGFRDDWLPLAEKICTSFGERPANTPCPLAIFAQPFGPKRVAIVQAGDQGSDDAGGLISRELPVPGASGQRLPDGSRRRTGR